MATILLIVIYMAYIGLGIPDSLFGTAWPAMHIDLGLSIDVAGYLTPLFSVFSIISSLASTRVIARFGTGRVAAASTALTVIGLFGYSISTNILWLILFSVPLGFGAGCVDAAMNSYVALHYRAMHMNFLHCAYGVGVSISPLFMSAALERYGSWQRGYVSAGVVQLVIAVVTIVALPLWGRVRHDGSYGEAEETGIRTVGIRELARDPAVRLAWLCFFSSCTLEYFCSTWGSTFLVECKGMTADRAAFMITFYFVGLTLARFLSGILSIKLDSWRIIRIGMVILVPAVVLILLPLSAWAACLGFFLIGFGNGPMYPNFMHLTPSCFGADIAQSVISSQMAAAHVSSMVMPFFYGGIVKVFGMSSFPLCFTAIYLLFTYSTLSLGRRVGALSVEIER